MNKFYVLFLLVICMGCYRVGPEPETPSVDLPDEWDAWKGRSSSLDCDSGGEWWQAFHDLKLDAMICKAYENNPDIHVAYHRLQEYRALFLDSRADQYPSIYLASGHASAELPKGGVFFGQSGLNNFLSTQNIKIKRHYELYYLGPTVAWEFDVFGRIKSENLARCSEYWSSYENMRALHISIAAEIARNYILLRSVQSQLLLETEAKEKLRMKIEAIKARLEMNKATLDNLTDAEIKDLEINRTIFQLQKSLQRYKYHLLTLMGETEWPFEEGLSYYSFIPQPDINLDPGVPSNLLQQRPDIRQADHDVAAATYRVGREMAVALPNFGLVGTIGGLSSQISKLISYNSLYWLVDPLLSFPIFDGGRTKANINVYTARANQAIHNYHKTLLNAVEEVQVALYVIENDEKRLKESQKIYLITEESFERKKSLYDKGFVDFFVYSLAEDDLHQRKIEWIQSEEDFALSYITLCKALGGKI